MEVRSADGVRLVLHVYQMHGADVVRTFRSSPFAAPASGVVARRTVLHAGEPEFGSFVVDPANLVEAAKSIPAGPAVDVPGRFIINGVFPFHPKRWESMETFYVVAAPADGGRVTRASVRIAAAFAVPER